MARPLRLPWDQTWGPASRWLALPRGGRRVWLAVAIVVLCLGVPVRAALAEAPAAPSPCDVAGAQLLAAGGDSDWSPVSDLIAYDQPDAAGVYQLRTIRPDGTEDRCLSCSAAAGAPSADRHKMSPVWHPAGHFIVLQGEMASHPFAQVHNLLLSELQINGVWTDLYATTEDGSRWWRLTQYAGDRTDGAMAPHFMPDGTKLIWSRLVEPADAKQGRPWGRYRLMLADFAVDAAGTPSLQNIQDITPADGGAFFEAQGFTPDGQQVVFASDRGATSAWGIDIWTIDLTTGALANLTSSDAWDEHPSFSPDGRTIAYMSSAPYNLATALLQGASGSELFVMNADGSNKRQVTHFNVAGYPESDTKHTSMPHRANWSADGSRVVLTRQLGGKDYPNRELWLLTFAGPCGAAPADW